MAEETYRVRMVATDTPTPGRAVALESVPMAKRDAEALAALADAHGIAARVHKA